MTAPERQNPFDRGSKQEAASAGTLAALGHSHFRELIGSAALMLERNSPNYFSASPGKEDGTTSVNNGGFGIAQNLQINWLNTEVLFKPLAI